jgi:Flp pilus assembly protein TadB
MGVMFFTGLVAAIIGTLQLVAADRRPDLVGPPQRPRVHRHRLRLLRRRRPHPHHPAARLRGRRAAHRLLRHRQRHHHRRPRDSGLIVGVAAYSLVVLLPGIAFRTRSSWSALNVLVGAVIYIASVLLRMVLHADSGDLTPATSPS